MKSKNVRAELKSLFSSDADPLKDFRPNGPFGISVKAIAHPVGIDGEEAFDFILCTPEWFAANMPSDFVMGRHYLFVREYNYARLEKFVRDYFASFEEESWKEVGEKLGRLGKWEFEDYVPYSPSDR